jgi:AcrR family transcriptional regulator
MYLKSANTITNIIAAAQQLFITKQYAEVTMAEIAEGAQVTKGALYHHFASKEELYLAMILADLQEKEQVLAEVAQSPGTCRERLHRLTSLFLSLPVDKQRLMQLVRRDINIFKDPIRRQIIDAYQAALPQPIEQILQDGIAQKVIRATDSRLLAWEYVALVEVVLHPYARRKFQSHEEMANYVVTLFFEGVTHLP